MQTALKIDDTWKLAGGYAMVQVIDIGLDTNHPSLRQFDSSGHYVGGNFINAPYVSMGIGHTAEDLSSQNQDSFDVDELHPDSMIGTACDTNPPVTDYQAYQSVSHGTHVAGLIAANGNINAKIQGTCRNCGIAMWRYALSYCPDGGNVVSLRYNEYAQDRALILANDLGAQVVNMSFGFQTLQSVNYCDFNSDQLCLGIAAAKDSDIAMIAASGNNIMALQFPALDSRVISVGGLQQDQTFWYLYPNCPHFSGYIPGIPYLECGSDYSTFGTQNSDSYRQELVASAAAVWSTTYPGHDWSAPSQCGDNSLIIEFISTSLIDFNSDISCSKPLAVFSTILLSTSVNRKPAKSITSALILIIQN
jgi:subtilisin family serine protease